MAPEELTAALAKINALETEAADVRASVHEAIEQARKLNDATRQGQAKLRAIDAMIRPLREAVAAHREAESIARKRAAEEAVKKVNEHEG